MEWKSLPVVTLGLGSKLRTEFAKERGQRCVRVEWEPEEVVVEDEVVGLTPVAGFRERVEAVVDPNLLKRGSKFLWRNLHDF